MIEIKKNYIDTKTEFAIIIGIRRAGMERIEVDEHLNELKELARTAGAVVKAQVIQERIAPNAAYFIGKGKLEEVVDLIEEHAATIVIFDDELTPAQVKNISKLLGDVKVIDRTALILDIFADHAQSAEAKTQVELAQLNYLLPRLTRAWEHLSRQVGGIGTKGPGETQLETDRRLVRTRISKLRARLKVIEKQNTTRRQKRDTMFRVALVGYTNAGKSTLMNALSGADVLIEDKLFATLDTTVRRAEIDPSLSVLLSDTVGFIRKLPHQLVASFRSTLAESSEADLLLHIVDVSHPQFEEHIDVVNTLLAEMDSNTDNRLLILNKIDLVKNPETLQQIKVNYEEAVLISAGRHLGLNNLRNVILQKFESDFCIKDLKLNFNNGGGEHLFHSFATVLSKHYDDEFVYLKIKYHQENEYKVLQVLKQNGTK
ncbi:MAG: GTPase HflX [Calditrichaeota bacterium]|nr:MAG: GTPase HflX [Calditrichota bacterium]MBL1205432.1 GTPase HflX [Calditrichota bacterium]NOG45261.1 GTPase HflX [Calditrichota bacterium]